MRSFIYFIYHTDTKFCIIISILFKYTSRVNKINYLNFDDLTPLLMAMKIKLKSYEFLYTYYFEMIDIEYI